MKHYIFHEHESGKEALIPPKFRIFLVFEE